MYANAIKSHLASARGLVEEQFDLPEALASSEPVTFWHSSNGFDYNGYELYKTDDLKCGIPVGHGHPTIERYLGDRVVRKICTYFFVEYQGKLAGAMDVWPIDLILWLGEGAVDRYRVELTVVKKAIPNDPTGNI